MVQGSSIIGRAFREVGWSCGLVRDRALSEHRPWGRNSTPAASPPEENSLHEERRNRAEEGEAEEECRPFQSFDPSDVVEEVLKREERPRSAGGVAHEEELIIRIMVSLQRKSVGLHLDD